MTLQQLDKMTKDEVKAREKKLCVFDESQSLEEYTEALRDTIYLWKFIDPTCEKHTIDYANNIINTSKLQIKAFYEEKEPISYAALDISFGGC